MQESIHPKYENIKVTCSCGNTFDTRSTRCSDLTIEVCSECHPHYTGKQKVLDSGGQIHKFNQRYNKKSK